MANPKLLPIALAHIGGTGIDGATRFQKLVFLVQRETELGEIFDFQADKYGPFSPELAQTLELLENRDIIEQDTQTTRSGHEKYVYSLTNKGHQIVRNMIQDEDYEEVFEAAKEIKNRHEESQQIHYSNTYTGNILR